MSEPKRCAIKLTDAQGCTGSAYDTPLRWGTGVTHTVPVWGGLLCRDGVLHCYEAGNVRDALALALLRDPNDAQYGQDARAWVCQGSGRHVGNGIKAGWETLTTLREMVPLPEVTAEQRAECAIRLALEVCDDPSWRAWATRWLDGTDRSEAAGWAAEAAAAEAGWAVEAAEAAAAAAAGWAAAAAAAAAEAAAAEARAAAMWAAWWAAGAAARWAAEAAEAAGWAARAAAAAADEGVGVAAIAGSVLLPEWVDSEEADSCE